MTLVLRLISLDAVAKPGLSKANRIRTPMTGTDKEISRIHHATLSQAAANCLPRFNPQDDTIGEFLYRTHISLRFRYIYFEVPKAACSTIKLRLIQNELGRPIHYGDMEQVHMRQISPLINPFQTLNFSAFAGMPDIFKFAFVRHPVSRLLSAYRDKVSRPSSESQKIYSDLHKQEKQGVVTFEEFIDYIVQRQPHELNSHWRPQACLLNWPGNKLDFVGKFESFEEDFKKVTRKCKLAKRFVNDSIKQHRTGAGIGIGKDVNRSCLEKIMRYYRTDFEAFNYG